MTTIRKPRVSDVPAMFDLMQPHIIEHRLLPRSRQQLLESLREYVLLEEQGEMRGLASLRLVGPDLAEIGAFAAPSDTGALALLDAVLDEARDMGVPRAFVLASPSDAAAFEAHGFRRCALSELPEKRDRQCLQCPRLASCQQVALDIDLAA